MEAKGKVVVITGGGSGIGAASAYLFAKNGAHVVLADQDMEKAGSVLKHIQTLSSASFIYQVDVTQYDEVEKLLIDVKSRFGRIDILVNSAGVMNKVRQITAEHSFEDWDRVIAINQTGTFYCMRAALKVMVEQGFGNIVNLASLAGLKASGFNLAYTASKFAVVGMTKSAALEYASKGIRINAVCPSYTQTPMLEKAIEDHPGMDQKLLRYTPMGRFGEAKEIAEAVLWLASEKSSFITGQTITLDGGLSL